MKTKPTSQSVPARRSPWLALVLARRRVGEGGFFNVRVLIASVFCLAGISVVLGGIAFSRANNQGNLRSAASGPAGPLDQATIAKKIAPWVIEHTGNDRQAEFIVVLADQADLSGAAALPTKSEKGRYVYQTLWNKSQATQGPILQWLSERGIQHQSYYIVNAILVMNGNREIAEALAARPDVARIEGNPQVQNHFPQPDAVDKAPPAPQRPATIEPGISYTHAPGVWALGFTGQNIVVASADTGVRWTHNALKPHYRGWDGTNANHDYNWHDSIHNSVGNPCGNDSPFPCDDLGHGSHTTGTMIGDDGTGNQIGMAPGAKWIGCRNMDSNTGSPARYIECMEWFLAPTRIGGGDPDPTKAPDITNNSWECPPSEGCSANTLQAAVEAQAAAGIMMVSAAQNSGPGCSTVQNPPGIYAATYTAGALNTGSDTIASFSSRGPVTADGSGRIKPDITAPGTGTRSSYNTSDTAYANLSGTSMATPHIAGATALLWSAMPSLRHQLSATRDALNNSAHFISSTQCGTAGPPNNVYGWGRVDILAAVVGPTPTPTPTPTPCGDYTIAQIGGSIVPGTTDIGNHGDDTVTTITLPFPICLHGTTYTSVNLSSNGNAQFMTTDTAFTNQCLPWTTHDSTIYPYWDDLYLVNSGFGIFTSVSGTAPNRIFNIEWRAQYFPGSGTANFELRLYEGSCRFDVIYGTVTNGNTSATAGVQRDDTGFDQYFCNGSGAPATGGQSYTLQGCPMVTAAVSRKTHGAAGTFDIAMPLTGSSGVECRTSGATNDYSLVVTFSGNVTVTGSPQAQVTSGTGCVGSGGVCAGNVSVSGAVVTVPLTNIANAQVINVRINGVNSAADAPAANVDIPMGILVGDTNANRTVNAADVAQTKGRLGQTVDGTDFRSDVNANGSINAADTAIIKQNSGTSLPP